MYNENKRGIADDISSRLPPIVVVGRSIFFLSSSFVFFLFSSFLCTMKRTRLSTRCVFFLSFFPPLSLFLSSRGLNSVCVTFLFFFLFSSFFFPKICGRKKGRKLFDHCDCVIGRTLGKARSLAAWPTIVEETKKKPIVERDAATSAYKMLESKESRRGKNFWKEEGGARTEDPSSEIVSLTEAESSACDEEPRNGRTMAKKNPCKRGENSRNREKERKFKIPHNGAKMESWDQRELSERKITIPRNKGSSTCDENENESERGERFSLARIKSPSKGSRRKRSFVLARNDWNGSDDEDEDEREGMKIHARRRSRGDGREKISFARMEREPPSTSSSNVVPHVRIERLANRDEIVDERDERKEIKREESSSASSGSLEWMDAGDARRYTKSYRCEWCEKTFDRATNLSSHVNRTCLRNPDTMRRQNFIDTLYVCDTCGRRFKHRKNLTFHSRNECGKVSTCEFCKKDFKAAKVPYRHREACKRRHEQTNATSVVFRTRASRGHDANDSIVSDSSTSNFMFEVISDSE